MGSALGQPELRFGTLGSGTRIKMLDEKKKRKKLIVAKKTKKALKESS